MKVLLATDGNEPTIACERLLGRLARRDGTALRVLAVNSFETVMAEAPLLRRYDPEAGRKRLEEVVEASVQRLRAAGFVAAGSVEDGHAATEILAVAARESVGLIAVGAGHTKWLDTLLLGSTSTEVMYSAACSVLVVHDAADGGPMNVVVGTDGSEGSNRAIRTLSALADPARCRVTVLAIAATSSLPRVADVGGDTFLKSLREEALGVADTAAQTLRSAGFPVETEVAVGYPATELLERAGRYDLAVVGCRGLGVIRRKVMGSVSDKLVRYAPATLVGR
jgi:nucleotide-binding universal stress UspA family protein